MNADGSSQRRLVAQSLHTSSGATWSPDGRSIVYSRRASETGADLWIAGANGIRRVAMTARVDRARSADLDTLVAMMAEFYAETNSRDAGFRGRPLDLLTLRIGD